MPTPAPVPDKALAYLTNQYPSVSHTFIRREIQALEVLGYTIHRFAVRPGGAVADPSDQEEARKTRYLLAGNKAALLWHVFLVKVSRPVCFVRALGIMWRMHQKSERGLLRHAAYLFEACHLLCLLRECSAGHVHVHFGTNAAAVARLVRVLGGPSYSMTIHGPDELDAPIGLSLGPKMEDAAFTAAITDYCGAQLRRWVAQEEWAKIKVVHCAVGEAWFDHAQPVPEDADTLVCVGRLCEQKGQLLLLDAFAQAKARGAKGRLVLVGDGAMRPQIEKHIAALGLSGAVEITGWQSEAEVRRRLLASRALVLASFAEGLPVVIMEAMALARPVVATCIMGIPELVRPGKDGWLAIAGSTGSFADALVDVLNAPTEALREMGENGRERVMARHRASTEAAKLAGHFDAVLTGEARES